MTSARKRRYDIAVIAGDGIGLEVVPAALRCLELVALRHEFTLDLTEYPWGSAYFQAHGAMMPTTGLDELAKHDAIFLGAVGVPEIPDVETLWGLLIPIRRTFDQYINLRPVRTLPGIPARVVGAGDVDLVIVRENVEGEYSAVGGRIYVGEPHEAAMQEAVFTRRGVARAARFAAELATTRSNRLTSATKSNGIVHTMPFWDEVVADTLAGYPGVSVDKVLIDALAAKLVLDPAGFDVIVASNLFGDILSDLAGAIAGSIGVAPSGNLNPEKKHPSMFEPVHGSAPDIAGQGVANPVGQLWAGAMMLEHLGEPAAAADLTAAFEACLADGLRTRDLGGTASTAEFTDGVAARLTA
ncbi:tartrate dehydrogenase [Amycolatopsis rhabdoformis]|uniref:D-malate dehydrogenase (decarboxylating) n=1 Tax=Amycolatopsis rhabdoformis TaxID=1448059 RepID=A0ABZ1IDK7_9PSEU|nr:tartrate dehydrogenase [Amycolatopsis rhabdoformis]WSE31624.1 tartrate dehydrogenase [Amycolatopsis rhabdoformis]